MPDYSRFSTKGVRVTVDTTHYGMMITNDVPPGQSVGSAEQVGNAILAFLKTL